MADTVWLTHPDVPNSVTEQPEGSSLVVLLKARGWVETTEPEPDEPALTVAEDAGTAGLDDAEPAARPSRRHTHTSPPKEA